MIANEAMAWSNAIVLCVFFVCIAAVVMYFLHLVAKPDSRLEITGGDDWRSQEDRSETEAWEADK